MKKRQFIKYALAASLLIVGTAFSAETTACKGNKSSKIYHLPACRYYTSKGSTEKFSSTKAAEEKGYRACKKCGKKVETTEKKKK